MSFSVMSALMLVLVTSRNVAKSGFREKGGNIFYFSG